MMQQGEVKRKWHFLTHQQSQDKFLGKTDIYQRQMLVRAIPVMEL